MGGSRLLEVVWAEDGGLEEKGQIKVTVLKIVQFIIEIIVNDKEIFTPPLPPADP